MPQEEQMMKMEKMMRQRRSTLQSGGHRDGYAGVQAKKQLTTIAANFQSFSASLLSSSFSIRFVINCNGPNPEPSSASKGSHWEGGMGVPQLSSPHLELRVDAL